MRLELVPPDEIDEPLWWQSGGPRFRPTADGRLENERRKIQDGALGRIRAGRAVRVATYVYATPGVEADACHALLAAYAVSRGTDHAPRPFTDRPEPAPTLPSRPQFALACRWAASGFADCVLAIDRPSVASDGATYEAYLSWLSRHNACLAYLQPALRGRPWTDQ
ncbi:hypothetical protein ACFT38_28440 [Streptomyces sp. NPDC056975]|uniref:hypothetical protein n=1 Tax=Streptomyces sp. NPDC056975 TaxID=3345985 RepID=UPI00364297D6